MNRVEDLYALWPRMLGDDGVPMPEDTSDSVGELPPLRSVHTTSFPQLLSELGISLFVTTYQANKLVVLRSDGTMLNTHFRSFNKPMGLAVDGDRLAIGTALEIWEYHNAPAVTGRLEPAGRHDACFLPRSSVTTGDIQIHEMVWVSPSGHEATNSRQSVANDELWFVNTRFSCLCTRSGIHSFEPRWWPAFITELAPEDRCHLNGLCTVPSDRGNKFFVTALGETDTPGGWRANKKSGGILIDASSNQIVLRGLSMPHSPRWYAGRLWLLESGNGAIGWVDPVSSRYQRLAELPGFTRGLDFFGRFAFVGLSQVRESAVFSGIAIADRPVDERCCGVWVLDIESGQTVAFVKFEDALQEIFAVAVLPSLRYPDLINDNLSVIADSFVLPDAAIARTRQDW